MLAKLSFRNVRRQTGNYLVYFITIILASALIFAFNSLVGSNEIRNLSTMMEALPLIVGLGSIVVVAILGWLMYYTQRFMLTKRSRELGTYILLGMENKQVAKIFSTENLVAGVIALLLGFVTGNFIYQMLRGVLFRLFDLPYTFSFEFSLIAMGLTTIYFAGIFLFSTFLCHRRICKLSIRALIEMDRQNEQEILDKNKSHRKMFIASILCAILGTALLFSRHLGVAILGCLLIILFCYGFFISFSSSVPAFFEKRTTIKYKGSTLLVFRSLSTKLASMGITMGTITLIFTATFLTEGAALLFQNQFNQNEILTTAFDLYIAAPSKQADMTIYEDYVTQNLDVTTQLQYRTYNADDSSLTNYLNNNTDEWSFFEKDQLMRYSDYTALRAMLGYEPVTMNEGEYMIHCMEHLAPVLKNYNKHLNIGETKLVQNGMHNEVLTQFTWDGNGRGFILIVPDSVAINQPASLDIWAMMTSQPVNGKLYQTISDIRDQQSGSNSSAHDTIYSRAIVKETSASMSAVVVFPLFYLSLVLIMVATTILTIQFLSDTEKYRQQFSTLNDLGMDKQEIHRTLNKQLLIFYSMPVLPPVIICVVFVFVLGYAFDPGIIASMAHLLSIIGICLALFFTIYLLYVAAASRSLKKAVLADL